MIFAGASRLPLFSAETGLSVPLAIELLWRLQILATGSLTRRKHVVFA